MKTATLAAWSAPSKQKMQQKDVNGVLKCPFLGSECFPLRIAESNASRPQLESFGAPSLQESVPTHTGFFPSKVVGEIGC